MLAASAADLASGGGVLLPSAGKRSSAPRHPLDQLQLPELPAESRIHQLQRLVHRVDRQLELAAGPARSALDQLELRAAADDTPAELILHLEPDREPAKYPAEYVSDYEDYGDYGDYGDLEPIPLSVRSDPEFRRAERLDIKKPGPWFGVNNYAFDYDFDGKAPVSDAVSEHRLVLPGRKHVQRSSC